eukprot:TRINITY_DN4277_c0_g2_i4.p1 TRINITY_DN4277_c0_g2~~TRINITY_DN4277_c0_g2_i4.p1  ORF type:complete len:454 (+),score=49.06 TRINITY_DN4277_c0_g2_i4:62-1363(+)
MADVLASLQAKCLALEEARDCLQSNYRFVNLPGIRLLIEWLEDNGHAGVAKEIGRHDKASQSEFATEKFNNLSDEEQDKARTCILKQLGEALEKAEKKMTEFIELEKAKAETEKARAAQAEEQNQASKAKYSCLIANANRYINLRARIYKLLDKINAFDCSIKYNETALEIVMWFMDIKDAWTMAGWIRETLRKYTLTPPLDSVVNETKVLLARTYSTAFVAGMSPSKAEDAMDADPGSSSLATTVVDAERVEYEYICDQAKAATLRMVPRDYHLFEKAELIKRELPDDAGVNRIVLSNDLHWGFDHDEISFSGELHKGWETTRDAETGRYPVHMKAHFISSVVAAGWAQFIRGAVYTPGTRVVEFMIYHRRPEEFLQYLMDRHWEQVARRPELGAVVQESQATVLVPGKVGNNDAEMDSYAESSVLFPDCQG